MTPTKHHLRFVCVAKDPAEDSTLNCSFVFWDTSSHLYDIINIYHFVVMERRLEISSCYQNFVLLINFWSSFILKLIFASKTTEALGLAVYLVFHRGRGLQVNHTRSQMYFQVVFLSQL